MPDRTPGRRPAGTGADGGYVETRKPTVDAQDDIYDEDGILMEEVEEENDLTLRVEEPEAVKREGEERER